MCLWLVQREGFERAEHLGAAGYEQAHDIVAWHEGQRWGFQCKRVQHFHPAGAKAEVDKVLAQGMLSLWGAFFHQGQV